MAVETQAAGEPAAQNQHDEPEFDLRRLPAIVRRRAPLTVLVFAAVMAATVAITMLQTPIYRAEVTLLVQTSSTSTTSVAAAALGQLGSLGQMFVPRSKTQERLLEHPDLVEKAAQELGLITHSIEELPYVVDAEADADSDLLNLKVDGPDPGKAADLANRVTSLYLDQSQKIAKETSQVAADFLETQLESMRKELEVSEEALKEYQAAEGVADISAEITAAVSKATALATQADAADTRLAAAQQTADYFRREMANEGDTYIASATIARNPTVQKLQDTLSTLQMERASHVGVHGPDYPAVVKLDREIEDATKQLAETMETIVQSQTESANPVKADLAKSLSLAEAGTIQARAELGALNTLLDRERASMGQLPDKAMELGKLKRDASISAELYTMLMKNYQQMRVNEAMAAPGVRVISAAELPEKPIRPRKRLNLALGFAIGLLLAVLAAAIAEGVDDRVRTQEDVRRVLALPTLAAIPAVQDMPAYLSGEAEYPVLDDQFRLLRTSLRFAAGGDLPSAVVITSPTAGAGKTTAAFGLALTLAHSGQRTLLIDGDMRRSAAEKPTLATPGGGPGLSAALAGLAGVADCIRPTRLSNVHFLPAGDVPPNPVELTDSRQAQEILALLRDQYDVIVIDSPPCPAFAEAMILASLSDGALIVVDPNTTRARDARAAVERLSATGQPLLGVVLNRVRVGRHRYADPLAAGGPNNATPHNT